METQKVILVHGIFDNSRVFRRMTNYLKNKGFEVYGDLNLKPSSGKYGIEKQAEQLALYIKANIPAGQSINLIGFSMGGIVTRYFIQYLNQEYRIKHLITIASPHHGTVLAHLLNIKSCQQLRPKSDFLNALNTDYEKLKDIKVTSIWAHYDSMIIPNNSSRLQLGNEIILPYGIHFIMPMTKVVIKEVEKTLSK